MTSGLERLQTPALLVDLDVARHNVRHMLALVGGDPARWRPHTKSSKIPQVLALLLAAGVTKFKCATTREAKVLLDLAGAQPIDLLVAMPLHGANLARLAALAADFPQHRLAVLTEDKEHARSVRTTSDRLGLFVDLNPEMDRTGIPLRDRTRIRATLGAAGPAVRGLHFYEGQVRAPAGAARDAECFRLYAEVLALVAELKLDPRLELVTSGTPAFPSALAYPGFTGRHHTVSPGTVVYWDTTSQEFGIPGFLPAVTVLTRVISRPGADRVTCDAGSKALDAAAGDPCCEVVGWPRLIAQHPSEEHLPLLATDGRLPAMGTMLQLVPRHVCPTVNLADQAVLLTQGKIAAIAPVLARGHEV